MQHLSWEYRYAGFTYLGHRWGVSEFPTTWESCLRLVKTRFTTALASLFYQKYLPNGVSDSVSIYADGVKVNHFLRCIRHEAFV